MPAARADRRSTVPTDVPSLLVLTDRRQSADAGRPLTGTVAAAVAAGAPAVLLREKDLPDDQRRPLAEELMAITARHGAQLIVASDADLARAVGAVGVQLAAGDPLPKAETGDGRSDGGLLVGRSCHDHAEVTAAVAEGLDYVTVSPVAPTPSKPGYGPSLGRDGVATLTAAAGPVPVLALGGVDASNAAELRRAGAHGLAVMGAVMRAADPTAVVRRLLQALDQEPPR